MKGLLLFFSETKHRVLQTQGFAGVRNLQPFLVSYQKKDVEPRDVTDCPLTTFPSERNFAMRGLFLPANVLHDDGDGIVFGHVVHGEHDIVVAGVIARTVAVLLEVSLATLVNLVEHVEGSSIG